MAQFYVPSLWAFVLSTLIISLHAQLALASLYPTKPVANTIFTAGQAAQLKWVEDGSRPLLSAMSTMKIDLYAGNNTFLATIAKDIEPLALSTTVYIPPIIPANYHIYTLRFITSDPPQIVYTADFNIIPSPFSFVVSSSSPDSTSTTSSSILSRISPTQPPLPIVSGKQTQNSAGMGLGWGLGGRVRGSGLVDVEKMKFRIVFIVWPALVGLSLAM